MDTDDKSLPSPSAPRRFPGQHGIRVDVRRLCELTRTSARPSPYSRQVLQKLTTTSSRQSEPQRLHDRPAAVIATPFRTKCSTITSPRNTKLLEYFVSGLVGNFHQIQKSRETHGEVSPKLIQRGIQCSQYQKVADVCG